MRIIKPYFEIIEQESGLQGIYNIIEKAARVCYKSSKGDNGPEAKEFVKRLIGMRHYSVLEHGSVYLDIPTSTPISSPSYTSTVYSILSTIDKYKRNPYSIVKAHVDSKTNDLHYYISSNFRVLVENGWLKDLKYLCNPTNFHEKRVSVRIICDIGTSREFNRHRKNSISEQSTRYCNFSKNKFNNELTFILPPWVNIKEGHYTENDIINIPYHDGENIDKYAIKRMYLLNLIWTENHYMKLIGLKWKPEQARLILPLNTATEVIYTAFIKDWKHFFLLRAEDTIGKPHPQAIELANPLMKKFIEKGYIDD